MQRKRVRIKTRWRQAKATTRLFWRAVIYGITSATFAGATVGFANELDAVGYFDFGRLAFGYALAGLVYGLIAAPIIAVVMKLLAHVYYPRLDKPRRFRIAVGGFTLIAVGLTAPLFSVYLALREIYRGSPDFPLSYSAIILMWLFGVYLSQVLANKYIAEVSPKKRKQKPA